MPIKFKFTTPEGAENCECVICIRVTDAQVVVAGSHEEKCAACAAAIWVSPTTPLKPMRICTVCAVPMLTAKH